MERQARVKELLEQVAMVGSGRMQYCWRNEKAVGAEVVFHLEEPHAVAQSHEQCATARDHHSYKALLSQIHTQGLF